MGKTNNVLHFPSEGWGHRQVWRSQELPAITYYFFGLPVGTELLSCHVHLEIPRQLSSGRGSLLEKSGANSCATSLVSQAVTLAGRVPSWGIFIKNWQTEYLWIRELRNAHYHLRKKTKAKTKPPKPHNALKTGELIAHENEVLTALSSLGHRKKFQSTALPTHTHTPQPETNPTHCVNSWKRHGHSDFYLRINCSSFPFSMNYASFHVVKALK